MIFVDILLALLLALAFTGLLIGLLGRRGPGPWSGFLVFLLLLFLIIWTGGVWRTPVGPALLDVSWLGFVLVAVVAWLLLAAIIPQAASRAVPPAPPRGTGDDAPRSPARPRTRPERPPWPRSPWA